MGRKKKRYEEEKPWCFYCDREFDDEKILIQHQRAKVRGRSCCNACLFFLVSPKDDERNVS
jgi:hypothetical protein